MTDDALAAEVAAFMSAHEGTGTAWGIEIEGVCAGYARLSMRIRDDMTNGFGTVHGGMIFALADTAFAYACNSRNVASVAQGASIIFLSPAPVGETLVAEAKEHALSGRSGAYTVTVTARSDDRPIAHFQGQSRAIGGPSIRTENDRATRERKDHG